MKSALDDMDLQMDKALKSWAKQGHLPAGRSAQLQDIIAGLAYQERERRLTRTRTVWGLAAAIMACIWLLFVSCPIAAAAHMDSPIAQIQFASSQVCVLMVILTGLFLNRLFQYRMRKSFEVSYE